MFGRREAKIMILPGSVDNLTDLAHLHKESFRRGWSKAEMAALMDAPENIFLVARLVGKPDAPIVGFNIIRETAEEAVADFRADGHLRLNKSCTGSVLLTHGTSKFNFVPPEDYTDVDFGIEPVPASVTVSRDIPTIPGAR